jgi:hypothetical protein
LLDFAIGLAIAAGLYALDRPTMAGVAACVSAGVLAFRVLLPARRAGPVSAVARQLAHGVGHALTVTVLAAVYFTVFLLLRVWRTLTGNDSLQLKARPPGQSFWIDRSTLPETSPDRPY